MFRAVANEYLGMIIPIVFRQTIQAQVSAVDPSFDPGELSRPFFPFGDLRFFMSVSYTEKKVYPLLVPGYWGNPSIIRGCERSLGAGKDTGFLAGVYWRVRST